MKKLFFILLTIAAVVLYSCGPSSNSKRAKEIQDSLYRADSIARCVPEAESWDIFQLGMINREGLLNKYGNKRLRIKNLVLDNVMRDNRTIQCFAYSPKDSLLSNTSQKGDKAKKTPEWLDIVNDVNCKFNPDFAYYFELQLSDPIDPVSLKQSTVEEATPLSKKSYYYSILTVEGDSIDFISNSFVLRNCTIK